MDGTACAQAMAAPRFDLPVVDTSPDLFDAQPARSEVETTCNM